MRRAGKRDLAALLALNAQLDAADRFSPRSLRTHVAGKRVLVDVRLRGFCIVSGQRVLALMVSMASRRQGVGRALLGGAIAMGARRAETRAGNIASERLFASAGFNCAAIKARMYSNGEAGLVLIRPEEKPAT